MRTLQEIKAAIEQLPRSELYKLTDWLSSKFSVAWDEEIEEDIKAGRLDQLAQNALAEFRASGEDEALAPFLTLLENDIENRPERIQPFPSPLLQKARSLVKGVKIDLERPLSGED